MAPVDCTDGQAAVIGQVEHACGIGKGQIADRRLNRINVADTGAGAQGEIGHRDVIAGVAAEDGTAGLEIEGGDMRRHDFAGDRYVGGSGVADLEHAGGNGVEFGIGQAECADAESIVGATQIDTQCRGDSIGIVGQEYEVAPGVDCAARQVYLGAQENLAQDGLDRTIDGQIAVVGLDGNAVQASICGRAAVYAGNAINSADNEIAAGSALDNAHAAGRGILHCRRVDFRFDALLVGEYGVGNAVLSSSARPEPCCS